MRNLNSKLLASGLLAIGLASTSLAASDAYVPGEILVKFKPAFAGIADTTRTAIGAKLKRSIPMFGIEAVKLPAGMSVEQGIKYYKGLGTVEFAEPNYVRKVDFVPNDPLYKSEWHLPKVSAPAAWDISLGNPTVKIAVLDTGVNYNHEDLVGRVIKGHDWINNDDDPIDDHGHGTHVAGIVGANSNNSKGIASLAFNIQVIAIKVATAGGGIPTDASISGMANAVQLGARALNMSYGGPSGSAAEQAAVDSATAAGVLCLAAAGNETSSSPHYPAAHANCIAVAATDENDKRSSFSNYGADWVDVGAPGSGILSSVMTGGYEAWDGTSMATPVVASLAGLLFSIDPGLTVAEVRSVIESSTDPIGTANTSKFGRINAFTAVQKVGKPITYLNYPTAVALYKEPTTGITQGKSIVGGVTDMRLKDGYSLNVGSLTIARVGEVASVELTTSFTGDATKFRSASLSLSLANRSDVTTTVYAWNYSTSSYVALKSASGSSTVKTTTMALPTSISSYVSGGKMKFVVRGYVNTAGKTVQSYTQKIDQFLVTGLFRQ